MLANAEHMRCLDVDEKVRENMTASDYAPRPFRETHGEYFVMPQLNAYSHLKPDFIKIRPRHIRHKDNMRKTLTFFWLYTARKSWFIKLGEEVFLSIYSYKVCG